MTIQEKFIWNFTRQAGVLAKIIAADPVSEDKNPDRDKALQAFGKIELRSEYIGFADVEWKDFEVRKTFNVSRFCSYGRLPKELVLEIERFCWSIKNEVEFQVGSAAMSFEKEGRILADALKKEDLYGQWCMIATQEAGETILEAIGEIRVGFAKQ